MTTTRDEAVAAPPGAGRLGFTMLGAVALLIWSASWGVYGRVRADMGMWRVGGVVLTVGGGLGLAWAALRGQAGALFRHRWLHLLGCGACFGLYVLGMFSAIALCGESQQMIEVSLVNYLWPALTLLLSIPILGARAKPALLLGILLACAGVALVIGVGSRSHEGLLLRVAASYWPYFLAFLGAVGWASYSLVVRRWMPRGGPAEAPLFMLASGVVLLGLSCLSTHPSRWSAQVLGEIAYLSIFPGLLAYCLWEVAMRRGDVVLLTSASYLTPLFSTVFACAYLGMPLSRRLGVACVLIVSGACVCKVSVRERVEPPVPP